VTSLPTRFVSAQQLSESTVYVGDAWYAYQLGHGFHQSPQVNSMTNTCLDYDCFLSSLSVLVIPLSALYSFGY
jgi:hypothetical protein